MAVRRFVTDLETCRQLWNAFLPVSVVSDMWEFRMCFHRQYGHRPYFMILEDAEGVSGMMPLSCIDSSNKISFFPGEIWNEKTWLERTPFYVRDRGIIDELFYSCPEGTYLRYMEPLQEPYSHLQVLDEIGYVLYPSQLDFKLEAYFGRFSHKKYKSIVKVTDSIKEQGSRFYVNRLEDFDTLVRMSIESFGENSYLHDRRFRDSWKDVIHFLHKNGWLRMISLEIMGKTAAVDIGSLYKGVYTVYLGGASRDLPGVAKVMNMYHIEYAFINRLLKMDFLCGDFHWKKLFHLTPEPLYKFVSPALVEEYAVNTGQKDSSYPLMNRMGIEDPSTMDMEAPSNSKYL
ncbi:MAG TPA: GNAT family N-acetyltransferase [Desulfatiglandales bacterium]|nr:GNAT family N-acetyltransferase [Desulfatiglandales bacterium]